MSSNSGSSPANDSPTPPSPLTDPALQLVEEAKELVESVSTVTSDEKGRVNTGTQYCNLPTLFFDIVVTFMVSWILVFII